MKRFLLSLFILLALAAPARAFDIPAPDGYVTDETGTLSYEDEMALELKIQEIEASTTAEIGILMIETAGEEDIATLAFDVGNEWGVGKAENDNGLMILIALQDHTWFMATGYGLEGTLPDAITKRIAERDFPSHFREDDYSGGLMSALSDIQGYLEADPTVIATYNSSSSDGLPMDDNTAFWLIILIALTIAKSISVGLTKNPLRSTISVGGTFLLFLLTMAIFNFAPAIILAVISSIIDMIIMSDGKGGGSSSSGSSSGSSWWSSGSGGSSWGGSSGGGGFGGGSFGGGGSGGRW